MDWSSDHFISVLTHASADWQHSDLPMTLRAIGNPLQPFTDCNSMPPKGFSCIFWRKAKTKESNAELHTTNWRPSLTQMIVMSKLQGQYRQISYTPNDIKTKWLSWIEKEKCFQMKTSFSGIVCNFCLKAYQALTSDAGTTRTSLFVQLIDISFDCRLNFNLPFFMSSSSWRLFLFLVLFWWLYLKF